MDKQENAKTDSYIVFSHDKFFKAMMDNPLVAQDLLSQVLPNELVSLFSLKASKRVETTFIDPKMHRACCDVLFEIPMRASTGYVYILFEHMRTVDRLLPLRLVRYIERIWARAIQQSYRAGKKPCLPVVFPMVIFNGKQQDYCGPLRLAPLFEEAVQLYLPLEFKRPVQLINLNHLPDHIEPSHISGLVLTLMTAKLEEELVIDILKLCQYLRRHRNVNWQDLLDLCLQYVLNSQEITDVDVFQDKLSDCLLLEEGEVIMTGAEQLIAIGRKEGLEKGVAEGLMEGRQEGRQTGLLAGLKQGRQEGWQKGIEQGRAQSLEETKTKLKQYLFEKGIPSEIVDECFDSDEAEEVVEA